MVMAIYIPKVLSFVLYYNFTFLLKLCLESSLPFRKKLIDSASPCCFEYVLLDLGNLRALTHKICVLPGKY